MTNAELANTTFLGIDLGGPRGRTTAVARLSCAWESDRWTAVVEAVSTRAQDKPFTDDVLLAFATQWEAPTIIGINAPLTAPACQRCQLNVCPGVADCVDPAVVWLRTTGVALSAQDSARKWDRVAATSAPAVEARRSPSGDRGQGRVYPYAHRCTELKHHYERGMLSRDTISRSTGTIAGRGQHLTRQLARMGFTLNDNLLEVSPRCTVQALFGRRKARGYRRDADPWETRAGIVEHLADLQFSARSRLSREQVLRNDHCFEALISGYSAFLAKRDGWVLGGETGAPFDKDGWIWVPPEG